MPLIGYFAGILTTLACLIMLLPLVRTLPRQLPLPAIPWQASLGAALIAAALPGAYLWLEHSGAANRLAAGSTPLAADAKPASGATGVNFADAAKMFSSAAGERAATPGERVGAGAERPGAGGATPGGPVANASSMDSAVASLESRLAKGNGTAGDWELLAKSYEFLGRPADASKARARQLPGAARSTTAETALRGEVNLAESLRSKVAVGETLFIVAKSVDSPGAPVAVFRSSVGSWPLKFTLDDTQSMLPGRTLSTAGRVTIEARVSHKGQPLPAPGDLQGSTGVLNPTDRQPLKILIDHVIT